MFVTATVISGWQLAIANISMVWLMLLLMTLNTIMMEQEAFGYSVNVLRNYIDITWAMFVIVCVLRSWIVGITRLSVAWFLTQMVLILFEFLEVQTFRPHVLFLQRDTQLSWMLIFVAVSVVCSWIVGTTGLSLAWLLLLLALVVAVWKTSLMRLVEAAVNYETLRVRRKRALSHNETAEWFNFLLNRW